MLPVTEKARFSLWKSALDTKCYPWPTVASMAQPHSTSTSSFPTTHQRDPSVLLCSHVCAPPKCGHRTIWLQSLLKLWDNVIPQQPSPNTRKLNSFLLTVELVLLAELLFFFPPPVSPLAFSVSYFCFVTLTTALCAWLAHGCWAFSKSIVIVIIIRLSRVCFFFFFCISLLLLPVWCLNIIYVWGE